MTANNLNTTPSSTNSTTATARSNAPIPTRFILNIYGLNCSVTSDLSSIAQDCQSIRTNFVPFHLTHSTLLYGRSKQSIAPDILLAGSDKKVHLYRWKDNNTYAELPHDCHHPLHCLLDTPSAVLSLDIICTSTAPRTFLVAGCQDGLVRLASLRNGADAFDRDESDQANANPSSPIDPVDAGVPPMPFGVDCCRDFYLDGPISSARFFSPSESFLCDVFHSHRDSLAPLNDTPINRMQRRAFDATTNQTVSADANTNDSAQTHLSKEMLTRATSTGARVQEVRLLLANTVGFAAIYR